MPRTFVASFFLLLPGIALGQPSESGAGDSSSEEAEEETSSGRTIDLLWIGPELGLSHVNLKTISYEQLLPSEVNVESTGPSFGVMGGFKLSFFAAALHLNVGSYDDFDIWSINLDAQLRIPVPLIEPYFHVGLGYAFLGSFGDGMSDATVDGWDARVGAGLDIYPSDYFSFGGGFDFTIYNLTRSDSITSVSLTEDGNAVGIGVFAGGRVAVHL
jgi:hypothetical protein